jgi:hypothetical protein
VLEVEANIVLKIGVRATIGIAAIAAASGVSISSSARTRDASSAAITPATIPIARPTRAFSPVMRAASRMVSCCRRSCSKIALGLGSTKGSMSRASTNHSQSSRKPTPKMIGGQTPWKIRPDQTARVLTPDPPRPPARDRGRAAPRGRR